MTSRHCLWGQASPGLQAGDQLTALIRTPFAPTPDPTILTPTWFVPDHPPSWTLTPPS